MRFNFYLKILMMLFLSVCPAVMEANVSSVDDTVPDLRFKLYPSSKNINPIKPVIIGLSVLIPEGWKIFWRSPGEIGYPTKLDFSGSENIKRTKVLWPFPTQSEVGGLQVNTYTGRVLIPIQLFAQNVTKAMKVKLLVACSLCNKESCIPFKKQVQLSLPIGNVTPGQWAQPIQQAVDAGIVKKVKPEKLVEQFKINSIDDDSAKLVLVLKGKKSNKSKTLLIEGPDLISFKNSLQNNANSHLVYSVTAFNNGIQNNSSLNSMLHEHALRITFIDNDNALESWVKLSDEKNSSFKLILLIIAGIVGVIGVGYLIKKFRRGRPG